MITRFMDRGLQRLLAVAAILLSQVPVGAEEDFPFITTNTPITLLSTNDGERDPEWRRTPEGLVDYEIKTPDSITVIRLFPDQPPVSKTVEGTVPSTFLGPPSMAISADGRFGLITNHDRRPPWSRNTYPEGTVLKAKSSAELIGKPTPPLTNVLTLIDLVSPKFPVLDRVVFEDQPIHVQMMPDKKHFVVGGSESFYVFAVENKRLVQVRKSRHDRGATCFWISPTGNGIIATQNNGGPTSINWYEIDGHLNIVHNAEVKPRKGVAANITRMTAITRISPDGRIALVCQRTWGGKR